MKEQYLAMYKHRLDPEQWINAKLTMNESFENSRYCKNLDEAKMYINKAKEYYGELAKTDIEMEVIETKIKVRKVTEWKTVTLD